jgi:radical SAM superfamily enzyme YgiQ (UPF0313 family)
MKKKAILVHLNGFTSVTPLVGGYLKAFAEAESDVRSSWDIDLYNDFMRTPASQVLADLVEQQPDVVCFSVYTWNVRLVMRLLSGARGVLPPATQFLLGGVEVMHCADRFLQPSWENVAVCNGEGERTFRDYLRELGQSAPDLTAVRGLSIYRDGDLVTTPMQDRIKDLSEIPSPWLNGIFTDEDLREVALFETNRGCPFKCEFCYWGGAIGQKITRLEVERVKEELTYIARKGTTVLVVCDANFGQLREDLEIAEHLARLKREFRAPSRISYNSAKNRIDRVEGIARTFAEVRLLSSHPISLQTLSPRALELARRSNIKADVYLQLQQSLNEWNLPSYIELIWPLPGETLESFEQGIDDLCAMGAQTFVVHPLLWLNNVGYTQRQDELGVSLLDSDDTVGGPPFVIQTSEVPYKDYVEGLLFTASLLSLYTFRGLFGTMHLLHGLEVASYREVLSAFASWMRDRRGDPFAELWHSARIEFERMSHSIWPGSIGESVLNSHRGVFDQTVVEFARDQLPRWLARGGGERRQRLEAAVEFDLLARPYVYLGTKTDVGAPLQHIEITSRRRLMWAVRSPFDFPTIAAKLRTRSPLSEADLSPGSFAIEIDHRTRQSMPPPTWLDEDYRWNTSMAAREIGQFEPKFAA